MPYSTPAWMQHQQEVLEALDRLINAATGYRAAVAMDMPSVAVAQQLAADVTRVVAETGQMAGLANAAMVSRKAAA